MGFGLSRGQGPMVSDITEDFRGVTVHAAHLVYQGGPVFYASLPCLPSAAENQKQLLATTLWDFSAAYESPFRKQQPVSCRSAVPIEVVRGLMGRPHLLLGEYQGPSISFSEGGGTLWAALSGDESDIGIDAAAPHEFQSDYPFRRAFHTQELHDALRLTDGNAGSAAALLWSIKEAAVKALGCGFHLVDPLQITVCPSTEGGIGGVGGGATGGNEGYTFSAGLSGKALQRLERFPLAVGSLWVRSFHQQQMWLSVALLKRRPAGHE